MDADVVISRAGAMSGDARQEAKSHKLKKLKIRFCLIVFGWFVWFESHAKLQQTKETTVLPDCSLPKVPKEGSKEGGWRLWKERSTER